jgi:hypothetical protein
MKKTAKYYKENPEANKKKLAYQKEYNKKPEQRKKRAELVKINRESDKKGIDRTGKDYDHSVRKYVKSSTNRGRTSKNGGNNGDKKARG